MYVETYETSSKWPLFSNMRLSPQFVFYFLFLHGLVSKIMRNVDDFRLFL